MNLDVIRPTGAPGYRLVRWIGVSGAASVYVATELPGGRPTAVKLFRRVNDEGLVRLEQLLQASAQLSHPNIVRVQHIGRTADGRLFHSMPLLLGFERKRHDLLGRPRRIASLLLELLDGLGHAHRRGMVHGGIKPSNVLFDEQGHAQLADFGIARCLAELGRLRPDATGYLSPEQARGEPPGPCSDVYSVGILAYELLTGLSPAEGWRPAPPRLPPEAIAWQVWMDRALAASPEQRFQGTREMADTLAAIVSATSGRRGHHPAARTTQRARAPKWTVAAAIVAAAIATLAGWAVWRGYQRVAATSVAPEPAVAATGAIPALSTTIAQPAPTSSAVVGAASLLAERVQGLITAADALRARGHLLSPPFHNAASHYLAALALDPGNPAATAGVDTMLATLRGRLDESWDDDRGAVEAADALKQGDALAKSAGRSARHAWRNYRDKLAQQVGNAVAQAARAHDPHKVAALKPLARALPAKFPDGLDLATAERVARTPRAGEHMRDPGGPLLVYVPAAGKLPAFAIAQVEVTRADYAVFARATDRRAAKCREPHNPFSRLRHLSWQTPGFTQADDDPAVCVSWDDAVAYTAWLSERTGQHYRLASSSQWLRAAHGMPKGNPCQLGNVDDASRRSTLDNDRWPCNDGASETAPVGHYAASAVGAYDMYGNVSEWLAGGTPGARSFRGLSWRHGSHETALGSLGTADSDIGYTSVGFRVVRAIDGAPPAVSGR